MRTIETPVEQDTLDVRGCLKFPFVWNRGGLVRVVPMPVLRNALATYEAGVTLMKAGLIESIPPEWSQIVWEACRPLDRHSPVKVNL